MKAKNPVSWFEIYVNDMDRAKKFYEEVLQYYITEERDGESQITESFYRKLDEVKMHDTTTKYGQINLILAAQDMKDEKTTMEMLENYYRMEYTVNRLFAPIKE